MSKIRKLFVHAILASLGVMVCDMDGSPGVVWTQEKEDRFVRSMNKHMPLTDEVVLLGIKGAFKEVKILQNFGRVPGHVKAFDLGATGEESAFRELSQYASSVADSYPYHHLVALDIFSSTLGPVPILPDANDVVLLSVCSQTGEMGLVDIVEGGFTGCDCSDRFYSVKLPNKDYDYLACCRVLMHAWPD